MKATSRPVDFRIHLALSMCAAALKHGPELPPTARALIIGAMELLLDADQYITERVNERNEL